MIPPWRRFRRLAQRLWADIPPRFRADAVLLVHEEAYPDPEHPEVFLLGMCEVAFAELTGAFEGVRPHEQPSLIHLWYGSFIALAERAEAFDWQGELEETILHELTHHWEHRAGLDGLDRFDEAQLINFQRVRGLAVPAYFWRDGEPAGDHRWVIDGDLFVEAEGPPPWTVDPGDGGPPVTCEPDPEDGWATIYERGAPFDGRAGDLVVAPRPPERPGLFERVRRWFGRDKESR